RLRRPRQRAMAFDTSPVRAALLTLRASTRRSARRAEPLEHGIDRAHERLPLQPPHGQRLAARTGDPVDTAAPTAGDGPSALDQTVPLEPVEGRVDRPF